MFLEWDTWFFTRWVPGLTIAICNKVTGGTSRTRSRSLFTHTRDTLPVRSLLRRGRIPSCRRETGERKKGKRSESLQFARLFIEWIEKILIFSQRFQSFKSSSITFNLCTLPTYVALLKKGLLSYKTVLVVHSWQHEQAVRNLCIKSLYFSGRVPRFYGGRVAKRVKWLGNSSFGQL